MNEGDFVLMRCADSLSVKELGTGWGWNGEISWSEQR